MSIWHEWSGQCDSIGYGSAAACKVQLLAFGSHGVQDWLSMGLSGR